MAILDPLDPLKCYCGRATKIYDSLFRRNFCSDECSTALRLFLGGTDKSIEVMNEVKPVRSGDFQIRGGVVTLHHALAQHQQAKVGTIDAIDARISAEIACNQERNNRIKALKKIGLADSVIDAMLKAEEMAKP